MLMVIVWIVAGLVVLAVLGSVLFGVAASLRRLRSELSAFERELQPVLDEAQSASARATALRERSA